MLNRLLLDKKSQEVLANILLKDTHELNADNIAFLKARRDYLTDEEKKRYSKFLEVKQKEETTEPKKTKK